MQNIETKIEGDTLTIKIALKGITMAPSKSGKTRIVASTNGNQKIPCDTLPGLTLGLNAYVPAA